MDAIPSERATTFRNPSTANLAIDSRDRTTGTSSDFTITLNQNIMTGFFTRLGVNEITLLWNVPNIMADRNDTFRVTRTVGSPPVTSTLTVTFQEGFYTVEQAMDWIVTKLNTEVGSTVFSFEIGSDGVYGLYDTTGNFIIESDILQVQLGFVAGGTPTDFQIVNSSPNLQSVSYIDFVSNNLTYCQDLKDSSTSTKSQDILYRWSMGWDSEPNLGSNGFPILQGYTPFCQRRYLSFPKQIKWDNNQPVGQLDFSVYARLSRPFNDINGNYVYVPVNKLSGYLNVNEMEYNINLLVSEQ